MLAGSGGNLLQLIEALQMIEHGLRIDAEVDEASNLINANILHSLHHFQAALLRAKQSTRFVVAIECMFQQRIQVLVRELTKRIIQSISRTSDRREALSVVFEQIGRTS